MANKRPLITSSGTTTELTAVDDLYVPAGLTTVGSVGVRRAPLYPLHITGSSTFGSPATTGSAVDPTVSLRLEMGGVSFDTGVMPSGDVWVQNRLTSNYASQLALCINPIGGYTIMGKTSSSSSVAGAMFSSTFNHVCFAPGFNLYLNRRDTADAGAVLAFGLGGNSAGNITVTSGGTTYNSTSDYRLKTNVRNIANPLGVLKKLKPCMYDWIRDPELTDHMGFLAHELSEVIPYAVVGAKDAVDDEGGILPQSVDVSKLVPLLVAAVQELASKVSRLERRLSNDNK